MATMKTIKEVAKATGMKPYSIREGISSGIYPAIRASGNPRGKYLIDVDLFDLTLKELANGNVVTKEKVTDPSVITPIRRVAE